MYPSYHQSDLLPRNKLYLLKNWFQFRTSSHDTVLQQGLRQNNESRYLRIPLNKWRLHSMHIWEIPIGSRTTCHLEIVFAHSQHCHKMIGAAAYMYFPLLTQPLIHGHQYSYRPMRTLQFVLLDWIVDNIALPCLGRFHLQLLYTTKQHPKPIHRCIHSKSWKVILEC